jgi:hypothetical protein
VSTLIDVIIFGIWCYGLYALAQLAYVKSVPLRHRVVNHKAEHKAAQLDETARFIRDQEHELWPDAKHDHVQCAVCGPGPLRQGMVPSVYTHPFFNKRTERHNDGYGTWKVEVLKEALPEHAQMVSSKVLVDGRYSGSHTLMLDLDYPVTLMESTTTGHYHLYADIPMSWRNYRGVLKAMSKAGLIEQGYYRAALRQEATMLRPPWVKKDALNPGGVVRARTTQRRMLRALNTHLKQRRSR